MSKLISFRQIGESLQSLRPPKMRERHLKVYADTQPSLSLLEKCAPKSSYIHQEIDPLDSLTANQCCNCIGRKGLYCMLYENVRLLDADADIAVDGSLSEVLSNELLLKLNKEEVLVLLNSFRCLQSDINPDGSRVISEIVDRHQKLSFKTNNEIPLDPNLVESIQEIHSRSDLPISEKLKQSSALLNAIYGSPSQSELDQNDPVISTLHSLRNLFEQRLTKHESQ